MNFQIYCKNKCHPDDKYKPIGSPHDTEEQAKKQIAEWDAQEQDQPRDFQHQYKILSVTP